MEKYYVIGLTVVLLSLLACVTGQTGGQSQCQLRYRQSATACMQDASFNFNNVNYVATNGTMGTAPPDNIQAYKQRVCLVNQQLGVCGQSVTQRLMNSTLCLNPIDRQAIMSSFQTSFNGLDKSCAQPCRYTLMDELRQCYSFSNLQPTLISDIALVKQAVIGQNYDQVYKFCMKRQSLTQCMRQKILQCRDSARVLAQYDLDLSSFQRGLETLCTNIGVYLAGLQCFQNPIPQIRNCYRRLDQNMQELRLTAPLPTADQISLSKFCRIRLEQINCEMEAWSAHQYRTCPRVVTGMRIELACKVLPLKCLCAFPEMVTNLCNPLNYYLADRSHYNAAPPTHVPSLALLFFLLLSVVFKH